MRLDMEAGHRLSKDRAGMIVYLIRHSMTAGNLKKRYIGRTDEPLCEEGILYLEQRMYPQAERLYVSPMKRCIQTAECIYPGQMAHVVQEFAECDFGIFENKNYLELSDCPEYQAWIDSGGELPFPGGESKERFRRRSVRGFELVLDECKRLGVRSAALVVHGGTIMSIMERYGFPAGTYYGYQVGNGEGYELTIMDVCSGDGRIPAEYGIWQSEINLPPGQADWSSDYANGKNYKKLFFELSG